MFVDANVPASGDGSSWANAFSTLEAALAVAVPGDQIWCADGVYTPPTTALTTGYVIDKSLKLYGGWEGYPNGATDLSSREDHYLTTVLSGFAGAPAVNTYAHIVKITDVPGTGGNPGVVIDGFKITGADGINHGSVDGGGILCERSDLDVANCFFVDNWAVNGGGIYFSSVSVQEPQVIRTLHVKLSEFTLNRADRRGGGIYAKNVRGDLVNIWFGENYGHWGGGGVYLRSMGAELVNRMHIVNAAFWRNFATSTADEPPPAFPVPLGYGGGVLLDPDSNADFVNCTFAKNFTTRCDVGQAISINTLSIVPISNSIFWDNFADQLPCLMDPIRLPVGGSPSVEYSDVQLFSQATPYPGSNNILSDPLFRRLSLGLLSLKPASLCLDAANYDAVPDDLYDIDGNGITAEKLPWDLVFSARYVDILAVGNSGAPQGAQALDMGAYERP